METKDMKIIFIVIIALVCVGGIISFCIINNNTIDNPNNPSIVDNPDKVKEGEYSFKGTIVDIKGNTATINTLEFSNKHYIEYETFTNLITVDLKGKTFEKGDKVRVTYNGYIMETYPAQVDMATIEKTELSKTAKLYTMLIDDIIAQDPGLNGGMEYIAIDINSFQPLYEDEIIDNTIQELQFQSLMAPKLNEEDCIDIVSYLYKYHDSIKVGSYTTLEEMGLVIKDKDVVSHINGILINIEKIEKVNDNEYNIYMAKYRSALGAIFPTYNVKYENGQWTFEVTKMLIS